MLRQLPEDAHVSVCVIDLQGRAHLLSGKITHLEPGGGVELNGSENQRFLVNQVIYWSDDIEFKNDLSYLLRTLCHEKMEYVDLFNQVKNKFEKINNAHFDEFQRRDPEQFFLDHVVKILLLAQMMGKPAFKWMSDQLAQTVLPLERLLDGMPKKFPSEILLFLKEFFEENHHQIMTKEGLANWKNILTGISVQIQLEKMDQHAEHDKSFFGKYAAKLEEIQRSCSGNVKKFSESINDALLNLIYDALHLSPEARNRIDKRNLFKVIPFDQFSALALERISMLDSDPHAAILVELINRYLTEESIDAFLHDVHQTSDSGAALAAHNANIRAILTNKKINPELALQYTKTYEFSYIPSGYETTYDRLQAAQYLHEVLPDLLAKARTAEESTYDKKQKSQFNSLIKRIETLLETDTKKYYAEPNLGILKSIKKNINALGNNEAIKENEACHEFLDISKKFTEQFEKFSEQEKISSDIPKSAIRKPAHFRIEQWDKEKASTLFLGNEVDCCLAVGSSKFPAIIQRIMDDAMLFHVVVDLETKKPIALTWLYLATDKNNDIHLVGNFIEIKAKYGANEEARRTIINALMHYSGEIYCRDNPEIEGFIINELTYGWNKEKIDFTEKPVTLIDKVGGAFSPDVPAEERARWGGVLTCDRYYLNSLERALYMQTANFHVYDQKQLTDEQRQKFSSIEEKIFHIVHKHVTHQKKLNHDISNEELIHVITPLVSAEIHGKMGIFFDDTPKEKLSSILDDVYRVIIFGVPRSESLFFRPNIDAIDKSKLLEKWIALKNKCLDQEEVETLLQLEITSENFFKKVEKLFISETSPNWKELLGSKENVMQLVSHLDKGIINILSFLEEEKIKSKSILMNILHAESRKHIIENLSDINKSIINLKNKGLLSDEIIEAIFRKPGSAMLLSDGLVELEERKASTPRNREILFSHPDIAKQLAVYLSYMERQKLVTADNVDLITRCGVTESYFLSKEIQKLESSELLTPETLQLTILLETSDIQERKGFRFGSHILILSLLKNNLLTPENIKKLRGNLADIGHNEKCFNLLDDRNLLDQSTFDYIIQSDSSEKRFFHHDFSYFLDAETIMFLKERQIFENNAMILSNRKNIGSLMRIISLLEKLEGSTPARIKILTENIEDVSLLGLSIDNLRHYGSNLITKENIIALVENMHDGDKLSKTFYGLNASGLLTPENRTIMVENKKNADILSEFFVILHGKKLLTPENRQALVINADRLTELKDRFVFLAKSGKLSNESIQLLLQPQPQLAPPTTASLFKEGSEPTTQISKDTDLKSHR
ncbi:MAG TPA: hypothetical protein VNC84_04535 [Gammaproteobacteria bacterium]|jgi:hypothetical protein|nr:hypothetical protein [Gammaproteobacteria bacterium]